MKKIYLSFLFFVCAAWLKAATHTVTIVGTGYSPASLNVNVGDVVTIQASGAHPLVEVDQATWNANGATPMAGGWGTKTSNYTFTVTSPGTIYYVCSAHVGIGMKGQIVAASGTGLSAVSLQLQDVTVFPNPATDFVSVKLNSKKESGAMAKIYSINGSLIMEKKLSLQEGENTIVIDLSVLSKGNFILKLESEQGSVSRQISVVN